MRAPFARGARVAAGGGAVRLAPRATASRKGKMPVANDANGASWRRGHGYTPSIMNRTVGQWIPGAAGAVAALQDQGSRLRVRERA